MVAKKPASKTTSKGSGTYTSYKPNIPSDLKCLILHESPGESKTVNMFLPKGYMAMATIGHFLQTSSKELDLDIDTWKLNLKPDPNKRDVIANIQSAIDVVRANHGLVVLAGDPDREGRVINNSIIEHFKLKPGEYVVHGNPTSLVEKEYMKGVNTPIQHDMNMVESGLGRQALDKYVGWLLTELLWNTSSNYKPYLDGVKTMIDQKITNFETKNQAILKTNKVLQKAVETFRGLDFSKLEDFEERKGTSFGRVQTASLILLIMKELEKFESKEVIKIKLKSIDGGVMKGF